MTYGIRTALAILTAVLVFAPLSFAQAQPAGSPSATVWSALSAPAMDAAKSAHAENVDIIRDHIHITPVDGELDADEQAVGARSGSAKNKATAR
jgi:hypothetical protein